MPGPRVVVAWLITWGLSMVLWLWLTATTNGSEAIAGAGAAAIAATAFEVVREKEAPRFRPRLRWFRRAPLLPLLVVRDTAVVFRELVHQLAGGRRRPGRLHAVPIPVPHDEAEASAFHLVATVGISLTPNTYVIGFDHDRHELLVHQLCPTRPRSLGEIMK